MFPIPLEAKKKKKLAFHHFGPTLYYPHQPVALSQNLIQGGRVGVVRVSVLSGFLGDVLDLVDSHHSVLGGVNLIEIFGLGDLKEEEKGSTNEEGKCAGCMDLYVGVVY